MVWGIAALALLLAAAAPNGLREAARALEQEDYAGAVPLLEAVLESDPQNFEARFNLAYAYTELRQEDRAIEQYQKVVEQKPDLPQARVNLAMLLMRRQRAAEAVPHFKMLAEARADDFQAQLRYAHSLDVAGRPADAIGPYQRALELDPNSSDAALGLGQSLAKAERFDEAAKYYRVASQLDPELSQMMLQLAELLEQKERTEQALALYQEYLAKHDDAIAVRERVALLLMHQRRYGAAIPLWEQAVEQDPTAANWAALAEAYALNDQPDKALPAWRQAVEADPRSPELRLRYANSLLADQQFEEAARHYFALVERAPDTPEGWNGLAFSLYKVENYPGALKALGELRARQGEKPASIYLTAIIQDKLQMYEEALASYERFLASGAGMEDEEWKSRQRVLAIQKILRKQR